MAFLLHSWPGIKNTKLEKGLKLRRELLLTITQTSLERMNTNQWRALQSTGRVPR